MSPVLPRPYIAPQQPPNATLISSLGVTQETRSLLQELQATQADLKALRVSRLQAEAQNRLGKGHRGQDAAHKSQQQPVWGGASLNTLSARWQQVRDVIAEQSAAFGIATAGQSNWHPEFSPNHVVLEGLEADSVAAGLEGLAEFEARSGAAKAKVTEQLEAEISQLNQLVLNIRDTPSFIAPLDPIAQQPADLEEQDNGNTIR